MYEIYGWIKIIDSLDENNFSSMSVKINEFERFLSSLSWSTGKLRVDSLNGYYILTIIALPNRRRSEAEDLKKILQFVISNFPFSYGLINEFDEQINVDNGFGGFTTTILKRGEIISEQDKYLTPFIPVVEDF